jgi:spore maturation protein CgeB
MPEVSKNIDVSFVGTNRPGRMELMRFLNSQGVAVQIWGNSWPKETPNYMGEAIYLDNKRYVYNSSKIVLNHHYLKIGWNMRFIETLAMKAFQLVDQPIPNPFDGFFNVGQDFIIYDDAKQCAELIRYYLTNSEEREKIMLSGYTRCLRGGHTYRDRVKSILEMV